MEIEEVSLETREVAPHIGVQNAPVEAAQDPSSIFPVVIPPPIPEFEYTDYSAIRDGLLVEMDGISDPFEQMRFALMVLMPTLLSMQEQDLESLGHTQQVLSLYGEKLEEVQTIYNEIKDKDPDDPQTWEIAENMYVAAVQLQQYLELDSVMDPETRAAFKEDVDKFVQQFHDSITYQGKQGWAAVSTALTFMWDSTPYFKEETYHDGNKTRGSGHDLYYDDKIQGYTNHRNNLAMFQMGASSLAAQSQVVNALVDYDAQHYNDTSALFNDMFEQYYKQIQANIKNYAIQ